MTVFDTLDKLQRIQNYLESTIPLNQPSKKKYKRNKSLHRARMIINKAIRDVRKEWYFSAARTKRLNVRFAERKNKVVRRGFWAEVELHIECSNNNLTKNYERDIMFV
jgi:hypothetical protein